MNLHSRAHHLLSRRIGSIVCVLISSFAFGACGSLPPISTTVDYCCKAGAQGIRSYRIQFEDMPEFLKPMLRDEVSVVLDSKGLEYTEGDAHAVLTMTFVHRPLPMEGSAQEMTPGAVSADYDARFIAEIRVEMKNSVTHELLWSGAISKLHNATRGSYMHEAPARAAMRKALIALFADYPNWILEDS